MLRFIGKLLGSLFIILILALIGLGSCVAHVPDPRTGKDPMGNQVFEPSTQEDVNNTIGDGSTVDQLIQNFTVEQYPDYYTVLGTATSGDENAADSITYGDLDSLGRATGACGWITGEMRSERAAMDRDDAPDMEDPAGWPDHNEKVEIKGVNGRRDYHGYLWNRSHLLAWSLGGDMDAHNLVAGTRTQNVGDNATPGGMAYPETLARDWLDQNPDGRLWYAAVPLYYGDELIPRAVIVDIKTDDSSIDEKILVFNNANGFTIDYTTGETTVS